MSASCALSRSPNLAETSISEPPKTSCNIGEAMPITPMPALTFMHSTIQSSQNCGMRHTLLACTWHWVIMVLLARSEGGVQPSGFQPLVGTR